MENTLSFLSRVSIPLGVATSVIGGSAWLTTIHNKVESLSEEVPSIRAEFHTEFKEQSEKREDYENRLARIEGKLDVILEEIQKRRMR